jgi:hypothetical protein
MPLPSIISTWPQTTDVATRLGTGFHRSLFDAAIKGFEQLDNPLRLNNLATGLRELIRVVLRDLAPDQKLKACGWYKEEKDKHGNTLITRSQRIKYAVQGELLDNFVQKTLGIDINETTREFTKLIERLNTFTHIEEGTFGVNDAKADQLAMEALETFRLLYDTIENCCSEVREAVECRVREALNEELSGNVVNELEQLATHYTVRGVEIETVDVTSLDPDRINFAVAGEVECELQYGSSSDVEHGDGLVVDDSYPFTCNFGAPTSSPMSLHISPGSLIIDNSSFYE